MTLILAIMAIDPGFSLFAQSPVGARADAGNDADSPLDKYAKIGSRLAAFDPVARACWCQVLQECITLPSKED
jgi:hypothetical protein